MDAAAPNLSPVPDEPPVPIDWAAKTLSIVIVSDAWLPQVNGVVRTLSCLGRELVQLGHTVTMVTPGDFLTVPCPTQADIRLALARPASIGRL
ncbi:MAG TPA: hypothetical protein VL574_00475, partial [Stellaceae bacterium]|nr:hypothetical protein [Stellaceae bacterium]